MAILGSSKLSFHLQSRFISISVPWLKRNATTLCLKSRDHSTSSFPVKYIPKKYSQVNEIHDSENRVFDRSLYEKPPNPKQLSKEVFLSSHAEQGCSTFRVRREINNDVEVMQNKFLEESKEFDEAEIQHENDICKKNVQSGRTMLDAEEKAIEFLAKRAFTAVELRKKLLGKRFPPDIVEALIIDFQTRGLINDSLYAETFSRSRWSSSSWGPRRIKQALSRKGVSEPDAEKAIKLVFEEGESGGQELKLGMSKLSMEHLLVQASKQWLRGQDVSKETRKSRIIRWLQYRGFNWSVISFILKKLESQNSS